MKKKENLFIRKCFLLLVILMFAYWIAGEIFLNPDKEEEDKCEVFETQWQQVLEDDILVDIDVPGECNTYGKDTLTIQTVMPQGIENNMYLMFWSQRQDMHIYIDGELRTEYSAKDSRLVGKLSPAYFVFVKVSQEDAGRLMRVVLESEEPFLGIMRTVYYGDKSGIWMHAFQEQGFQLFLSCLMFFLGVLSVLGSIILKLIYKRRLRLEYLSWGIIIASIWLFANCVFRQMIFPNVSVLTDISFLTVMIIPMPFLMYMNSVQDYRYTKLYNMAEMLCVLDFVVCIFLQVTQTRDFYQTFKLMSYVCIFGMAVIVGTSVRDFVKKQIRGYLLDIVGIIVLCISALVQMYLYLERTDKPFNGTAIAIGLFLMLIITLVSTVYEVIRMQDEKQQAVRANESKDRFLSNMSHEIRTPMNAVLGMDEMILRESTEPKILEYASDIQRAGKSLLSIINDILDFSKIEAGKMEIVPVEYNLAELLNDVYNMVDLRAREKGLQLTCENDSEIPRGLMGDEVRVRQIVTNILTNAVKYTPSGSVHLAINYDKVSDDRILLKIRVTDTGIGIKPENIEKLFDSFQRLDEQKNRTIEGTGLGLSITKQLIDLMGGNIHVESVYGQGSTFFVEIPQDIVDNTPMGEATSKQNQDMPVGKVYEIEYEVLDGSVLVVDDMELNLRLMKALLRPTKLEVVMAKSGEECIEWVKKKKFDIIFLDHMMPEMDGVETLARMRELEEHRNQDTPVVMLTANAIVGAKEEYLEYGFSDYLSKPVDIRKLAKMILVYMPEERIQPRAELNRSADSNKDKIKKLFVKKNNYDMIQEAYEKEDWRTYREQMRILGRRCENINEVHLAELSALLEKASVEEVKDMHAECMKEYENVLASIAQ